MGQIDDVERQHENCRSEEEQVTWLDRLNANVNKSRVGRLFELKARKTTFTRELCAAVTVFLTVAQIIAVNPAILSSSGGPCSVQDCTGPYKGTAKCKNPELDDGYAACVAATSQALVATTCLSAAIGCFLMALLANMPLILAPGMGVNAFFTFQMVGQYGTGQLTYQQGMAVVLVTALLVLIASLLGLRGRLMQLIPSYLVFAMVVGLGLFLTLTGLGASSGIGLVVAHPETLVAAGGCPISHQAHAVLLGPGNTPQTLLASNSPVDPEALKMTESYGCNGGIMQSATTWLGIAATLLIVLLMAGKVDAAIAWGVLFATVVAWIPGHRASYFSGAAGAVRFEDFKKVVSLPNPSKTSLQFDFTAFKHPAAWASLFGMFYLVFLDSTGTAFAMAGSIDQHLPGFVQQPGFEFPRRMATLLSDALACLPGALMGTSPLIVMAESSVAVQQGGRTGLTTLAAGCLFLLAMFFAPLFSNIPPYATGPALIAVGSLMVSTARFINWEDIQEAFPAFVTIALMPFTYSISNGLLGGLTATFALWVLDIGHSLLRAALEKDSEKKPGVILRDKFSTWQAAFGDITWAGYKKEVSETFQRAKSTRLGRLGTLKDALSLRRVSSTLRSMSFGGPGNADRSGPGTPGHIRGQEGHRAHHAAPHISSDLDTIEEQGQASKDKDAMP